MAYTADIRCEACGDLVSASERTSPEDLGRELVTLIADCQKCGHQRTYRAISPSEVMQLLASGMEVMKDRYPHLLAAAQGHPGFPTPLNTAPAIVRVDSEGWVTCPQCRFRFKPSSPVHFNGQVHMRCKQRLIIAAPDV